MDAYFLLETRRLLGNAVDPLADGKAPAGARAAPPELCQCDCVGAAPRALDARGELRRIEARPAPGRLVGNGAIDVRLRRDEAEPPQQALREQFVLHELVASLYFGWKT